MKLSLNSHQVFDFFLQRMGLEFYKQPEVMAPVLQFWKDKGYEGITLYDSFPLFYDITEDQFHRLKATFDEAGIDVACMNLMRKTLFDPAVSEQEERKMYHTLEICGEILKAEIMDVTIDPQFPTQKGPQIYDRVYYRADYAPFEHFAVSAKILKKYAQACAGYGMELSIESKDDGLGDTADNLIKLLKMVDEPNVGCNPDVGNCFRAPYPNSLNIQQEIIKLVS